MARVDPDNFGICLATVDGKVYEIGDTREEFTIQSISKPFTYGLALDDLGLEAVDAKVDVEPSGDSFNEISLAEGTGRPANAMINAGALTATSLIKGSGGQSGFKRILSTIPPSPAGSSRSASASSNPSSARPPQHGARLPAALLQDHRRGPDPVLEDYFRQCSVLVNCLDLSDHGRDPRQRRPESAERQTGAGDRPVERVLSVMVTSGMYDDAGAWISSVGMPGKSGVAGGISRYCPARWAWRSIRRRWMSTAAASAASPPPSGSPGTWSCISSARPVPAAPPSSPLRHHRTPSGIRRTDEAADVLRDNGHRARVIELNGDLLFAGTESMVREISDLAGRRGTGDPGHAPHDQVGEVALRMLESARKGLGRRRPGTGAG